MYNIYVENILIPSVTFLDHYLLLLDLLFNKYSVEALLVYNKFELVNYSIFIFFNKTTPLRIEPLYLLN